MVKTKYGVDMPSFDVVNSIDMQEVDNAVNMCKKDIANRYDFRGTDSSITLNKSDNFITIETDNDYKLDAIIDMLHNRSISRKISLKTYDYQTIEKASGMRVRQKINLKSGISKEDGKKINVLIKNTKLKVSSQIQGEQLRVTAKKIDDLQEVISMLKGSDINVPLQFVNMKS